MGKPTARVTDMHICPKKTGKIPHIGGPIINGSSGARLGDSTAHGGKIVGGCSTVLIGDGGRGKALSEEAIEIMNAHKAQMRMQIEATEQKATRRAAGEALINDPPLEAVPILPIEAAAQAVVELIETVK